MTMDANVELLKAVSGFGLVGIVALVLGIKFANSAEKREARMQQIADEDRQWRNNLGESQMVLLANMVDALKEVASTNKSVNDTNTRLVAILEKSA